METNLHKMSEHKKQEFMLIKTGADFQNANACKHKHNSFFPIRQSRRDAENVLRISNLSPAQTF